MATEHRTSVRRDSLGEAPPLQALARAEDLLMALLVLAIFGVVLAGILARFAFHMSLSWSTEVSVTLMIWMTFLGIAMGVRDRVHVSFELFEGKLAGTARITMSFVQLLLMGFLLVVLAYGGYEFTKLGLEQLTPSGIPQWVSFSAIPVGCLLALLHLAVCAWDVARGVEHESAHAHEEVVA